MRNASKKISGCSGSSGALARIFEDCDNNEDLDEDFGENEEEEEDVVPPYQEDDISEDEEPVTNEDDLTDKDGRKWRTNPPDNRG